MGEVKRAIGFPVRLGTVIEDKTGGGEWIGRPVIAPGHSVDKLTVKTGTECPFCYGDLYDIPKGAVIGRIVWVEQGRVAFDPLPPNIEAIGCPQCKLTFYEERT